VKKVYVAGPYTLGDVAVNVRNAIIAADVLANHGFAPFVPHLSHFWHMHRPRSYAEWLAIDFAFLLSCDLVLRLPGESPGADLEVKTAQERNIPVYFDIDTLLIEVLA